MVKEEDRSKWVLAVDELRKPVAEPDAQDRAEEGGSEGGADVPEEADRRGRAPMSSRDTRVLRTARQTTISITIPIPRPKTTM